MIQTLITLKCFSLQWNVILHSNGSKALQIMYCSLIRASIVLLINLIETKKLNIV
jgi:hypothetical protein